MRPSHDRWLQVSHSVSVRLSNETPPRLCIRTVFDKDCLDRVSMVLGQEATARLLDIWENSACPGTAICHNFGMVQAVLGHALSHFLIDGRWSLDQDDALARFLIEVADLSNVAIDNLLDNQLESHHRSAESIDTVPSFDEATQLDRLFEGLELRPIDDQ